MKTLTEILLSLLLTAPFVSAQEKKGGEEALGSRNYADYEKPEGSSEKKTDGGFAELVYRPDGDRSTSYGVLMYNGVKADNAGLNYRTASAHAGYLVGRNSRLIAEYTYDLEEKANRFAAGFVDAF